MAQQEQSIVSRRPPMTLQCFFEFCCV